MTLYFRYERLKKKTHLHVNSTGAEHRARLREYGEYLNLCMYAVQVHIKTSSEIKILDFSLTICFFEARFGNSLDYVSSNKRSSLIAKPELT